MADHRFLPFQRYDPFFKTGLNEALIDSVKNKEKPIVFLAGWKTRCVNIGRSQELDKRVNLSACEEDGVEIVRRQGGGGTTFLTPQGEITWGVIKPSEEFEDDVNKIYQNYCGKIAESLQEIGIKAKHEPINDVVTENGKVSGATLREREDTTYVGGTLLYKVDPKKMFKYINPDPEKNRRHDIKEFKERVTSVKLESEASFEQTKDAVKKNLLEHKKWKESKLSEDEHKKAVEYAKKYRSDEWVKKN